MNRYDIRKILKISIFAVVSLCILGYIYFAFRDYIHGPALIVTEPANGGTIGTSTVVVRGQALRVQNISLNGKPLLIDRQGNFSETLLLSPGYNISLLSAVDKFRRTIEYKLELVYKKD